MPRIAKPFLHRGWYVTDMGGVRQKLWPESDGPNIAQEAFDRLKVERHDNAGRVFPNLTVQEAAALFLQHCEVEKAKGTFGFYRCFLRPLVKRYGNKTLR